MPPDNIFGYLIAAVITLSGAMAWLHRDQISRSDKDKKELKDEFAAHKKETKETISTLDSRLFTTLQAKQDAEIKAVRFELASRQPCSLAECPRKTTSFSVGEKAEGAI